MNDLSIDILNSILKEENGFGYDQWVELQEIELDGVNPFDGDDNE